MPRNGTAPHWIHKRGHASEATVEEVVRATVCLDKRHYLATVVLLLSCIDRVLHKQLVGQLREVIMPWNTF